MNTLTRDYKNPVAKIKIYKGPKILKKLIYLANYTLFVKTVKKYVT